MVQYHENHVITWTVKGSRDFIYQELGLVSHSDRRRSRKLFFFL